MRPGRSSSPGRLLERDQRRPRPWRARRAWPSSAASGGACRRRSSGRSRGRARRRGCRTRDLLQHAAVRVDEADVAAAGDAEVGVARLARAVDRAAEHGDLEVLRIAVEPLLDVLGELSARRRCRGRSDGHAMMIGPRSRSPSALRISQATLTSSTGSAVSETRIVSPIPSTSSAPMPTALLIDARERRARLGDAEVQRVRHLRGEHAGTRGSSSARGST